jgi:hypothetical protein
MAIPRKLLAPNMPLGDDSFEKRVVDLYPASANSATKYNSQTKILFQIPNYARSFIDFSKSFLKFDLKTTASSGHCRVNDGLPIFERMQVRVGAKSIEDIDSYYSLEKIMENIIKTKADKELSSMYGDYSGTPLSNIDVKDLQVAGETYIKRLYSGVLGNEEYMFPIHRLNTGNALEIELTTSDVKIALMNTGAVVDPDFEISNIKFQLCLLKVSDAFFNKYNSLANSNELVLPMTTYKRHLSNVGVGQVEPVVFVQDNAKNLKRTYTVFRTNPTSVGTTIQPVFLKGTGDAANKLLRYQYKYMSRQFPESPAETTGNHNVFLANLLTNSKHSMTEKLPAIVDSYDLNFVLVQSYEYSDDEIINGLNINASGSPLILELKFAGTAANPTLVETFSESSLDLVLDSSGNASIVQKTKMGAE